MVRFTSERVDPWLLAEQEKTLEGQVALGMLSRLAPLLVEDSGEAVFSMEFGRDEHGRTVIRSSVKAELRLECQHCLHTMTLPVDANEVLALVRGPMEAEQLPAELDPLLLQETESLEVARLVEDELLLSIPVSPRHETGVCQAHETAHAGEPVAETSQETAPNPFKVLAGLKTGSTDDS